MKGVLVTLVVAALTGCGGGTPDRGNPARLRAFRDFTVYDAGPAVAGLERTHVSVNRVPFRNDDFATGYVRWTSVVYGDCDPASGEGGCAPPLQIQSWPMCFRTQSLYQGTKRRPFRTIRGVPARFYPPGAELVLSTGRTTVVIYAGTRRLARQAARKLRPVNSAATPRRARLPRPAAGRVRCDREYHKPIS